jgi:hypothetical protein
MSTIVMDKLLDTHQLSELLQVQPSKLEKDRTLRKGIAYCKLGRSVRYRLSDVEDYLDLNRVETR